MHIRFTKFVEHGNVQHQAGDVLLLPPEFARRHIEAGHAVEFKAPENAVRLPYETATSPQARIKKGSR